MLRVSEHYVSTQGEGPRVGQMTQFMRFAGCNMRCPGWPCDTPHAIFPEIWRKESRQKTVDDLVFDCIDHLPVRWICWTGGEPFLQKELELYNLQRQLADEGFKLECFTNGSFLFPGWALASVRFIMDWKLEGSGEAQTNRPVRIQNALALAVRDCIKFVVGDMGDLLEAKDVYHTLKDQGCAADFYVGSVWGKMDDSFLVEWLIKEKLDWKLNVQVHKFIWSPELRGV